jgi:outer membrane protein TolC
MKYAILLVVLLPLLAAGGQPAASEEPVFTLNDLLNEALRRNPDVLAAQKKYEAAKARPSQEGSLPDPTLSLGYRNTGNPVPFTSIGEDPMANAGVSFSQELPFPGKLKLRGQMAEQEAAAALQDYQTARLRLVSRLKAGYFQLNYLYKAEESLEKNKDLLQKFARITESRYSVGQGQQQDILKAQVEVSLMLGRLRKLEQEKQSLKAELNSLLNRPPEAPLGRPADTPKPELRATLDELYARAGKDSPLLKREQAMVERSQFGLDLARRDYYPDFGVMGGYFNSGRFPAMYEFRFDVKVPLYFWRKQRVAVEEQTANLSAARHQYESMGRMLNFGVKEAYLAAQASDDLLKLYSGAILPQSTLALESSVSSYQVGAVDFLTLLTNLRTVLDYEVMYYEELAAFEKALARLEELTGASLL